MIQKRCRLLWTPAFADGRWHFPTLRESRNLLSDQEWNLKVVLKNMDAAHSRLTGAKFKSKHLWWYGKALVQMEAAACRPYNTAELRTASIMTAGFIEEEARSWADRVQTFHQLETSGSSWNEKYSKRPGLSNSYKSHDLRCVDVVEMTCWIRNWLI